MAEAFETRSEAMEAGTAKFWLGQIKQQEKKRETWVDLCRKIVEQYRSEKPRGDKASRFNILWSNTETLKASLLAKMAKPDVRRRWPDRNQISRQVALAIERALEYTIEVEKADKPAEASIEDHLLTGRGTSWVVYEPDIASEQVESFDFNTGEMSTENVERIAGQRYCIEHIWYEDYLEGPARCWGDVPWIARRHKYTREKLKEDFPAHGAKVSLTWTPEVDDDKKVDDAHKRAVVWEIWDKDDKQRLYAAEGYDEVLEARDDPYKLENFFPSAEPLDFVTTNDTRLPVPEYEVYRDQAEELNEVTQRIAALTSALKRRGIYDSAVPELARLAKAGDNQLIPSENYANFAQKGGFQGSLQWEDITQIAQVLDGLYQQRATIVQTIYEVTGISDVIRGSTDPRETATAQKLKGQFGSMRLRKRQDAVQKWVRDTYRLLAELICEHTEPEILKEMTGINAALTEQQKAQAGAMAQMAAQRQQQVPPELAEAAKLPSWEAMLKIMRSDRARSYRIDIETDSTVFEDAEEEKQSRIEFLTAAGGFMQQAVAAVQVEPALGKLAFEMLAFGVRGFKVGRQLEDLIDETAASIGGKSQQPQVNPEAEKVKAQAQADQQKAKSDAMLKAQEMQTDAQLKREEMQLDGALRQEEARMDMAVKVEEMQREDELARQRLSQDNAHEWAKLQQDREIAEQRDQMRERHNGD